jgi:RNA polymerase sigma factor (sigma-70 family)
LVVRREIGANKSDTSGKPFRSPLVWTLNSYNAYAPAGNLFPKGNPPVFFLWSPRIRTIMKASHEDLGRSIQTQQKKAIEQLYDQYADVLYGITVKIVRSEELAQDVLQEAFVKIWKNGASYDPSKGTVFTWALNITRNLAIDKTRSAAFRRRSQFDDVDVTFNKQRFSTETNTDTIGLKREVSSLDPKYQEVIDLVYFRGYTQAEVQDLLGIPLGTVKSRIRIGLRELRKVFLAHRVFIIWAISQWITALN